MAIPTESKAKGTVNKKGTGQTNIQDYLSTQVEDPRIAADAKQTYTKQTVQSNELQGAAGQAGTTAVGTQGLSAGTITCLLYTSPSPRD